MEAMHRESNAFTVFFFNIDGNKIFLKTIPN